MKNKKNIRKTGRPEAPLQNGKELKPIMIKPNMGRIVKPMAKFPDLSGDGKVTKKDILMGRGVINKPKMKFDGDKKLEQALKNATVLDNVDFGLSKKDIQTANTFDALRNAIKTKGQKSGRENRDLFKSIYEGETGNITFDKQGTGVNKLGFRLKGSIDGKRAGDDRLLIDTETGEISRADRHAVTPYLTRIGVNPKIKPNMINKPKMQNGKSLKELQADIERASKTATSTGDPNERDAALMKKRALIRERDDMIAANKKKSKTSKTNKTKPTMIKKKAKMTKPKMFSGTGSAKMTAKEKLAAAKKAKRAPGKAVRDARKGVRTENKNKRVAARATAKSARRATRATNLKGRIENKKARVTKRVTKSRATNKLNKLNKPAIRKPKMSYKKKK